MCWCWCARTLHKRLIFADQQTYPMEGRKSWVFATSEIKQQSSLYCEIACGRKQKNKLNWEFSDNQKTLPMLAEIFCWCIFFLSNIKAEKNMIRNCVGCKMVFHFKAYRFHMSAFMRWNNQKTMNNRNSVRFRLSRIELNCIFGKKLFWAAKFPW